MLAPAMIYLGIGFGLLVLTWMNTTHGLSLGQTLSSWDACGSWGSPTAATTGCAGLVDAFGQRKARPRWRSSPATDRDSLGGRGRRLARDEPA